MVGVQTYLQLIAVGDCYKEQRIRMLLMTSSGTRNDSLILQASEVRGSPQLQPSRRFAMIRFILLLVQEDEAVRPCPQAFASLNPALKACSQSHLGML